MGGLPPISREREPAGRSRAILERPVEPSGKAKVRSRTVIVGEAMIQGTSLVYAVGRTRSR